MVPIRRGTANKMAGKLYVVGTPIGNLGDFSERAKEVLRSVDFIAAEDTRVTVKLLNHFDIKQQLVAYFEHNRRERGQLIVNRILGGETAAIVTDAGMPAISDPGEDLVKLAKENGIEVESVPGPVAFATALAVSGMPSGRFCFEGFLSVNRQSRTKHLESLKGERRTMIFYEAPHKLVKTLADMLEYFGDREIAVARELTKIHETVWRTSLKEAYEYYCENAPRGEFVLIIGGDTQEEKAEYTFEQAVELALELKQKGLSASEAAKQAAFESGYKKGEIYKEIMG